VATPRSILKRPETAAAEKAAGAMKEAAEREARKAEEKAVARKRCKDWGKMTEMERRTYNEVAAPIKASAYDANGESADQAYAIQRVAHKVGLRAVEERWEKLYDGARTARGPPRQQQRQQTPAQQAQPEQQQARRSGTPAPVHPANWAQRAQVAAALPQYDQFQKVGRSGRAEKKPTGLEPIKRTLPWDERMIVFERSPDVPPITPAVATSVMAHVNITLSKVAPPHVWTTVGKVSPLG